MKFTVHRHKLTERLRPDHKTIKCFPSPYALPSHYKIPLLKFLLSNALYLNIKKKYRAYQKAKNRICRDSKSIRIRDIDIFRPGILNNIINMLKALMGRQQSRTHGKCRQRNGNPKEKKKTERIVRV